MYMIAYRSFKEMFDVGLIMSFIKEEGEAGK